MRTGTKRSDPPKCDRGGHEVRRGCYRDTRLRRRSEIRRVVLRNRHDVIAEETDIARFAKVLNERTLDALPALYAGPRHVEGTRIFDPDDRLQRLAAIHQLEALDHMDLV